MKELLENLPHEKPDYLLDTCFILNVIDKQRNKLFSFCKDNKVGITSFNAEEINHVHKKLPGPINHHIRDFFKEKTINFVNVDVHPGNFEAEKSFVSNFDPEILKIIPDASDAVLFVAAIKNNCDILTKDKHHLFTVDAENYIEKYNLRVDKEFPK